MAKHKKQKQIRNETANAKPKDKSPFVPQRDKISYELAIRQREDLTEKQKKLIDLILDRNTRVVFVTGPAGTAKTYVSVLAGLTLLNRHSVSNLTYIRSVIESASRSLGFLPGEADMKFQPYLQPLQDKLDELLPAEQVNQLLKEKRAEGLPVNFLRGSSLNAQFIIADESQNFDFKELTTIMTRIGPFSKLIICGDAMQSDINGRSGFVKMADLFNDETSRENGIHYFSFTKEDIVRSGVVKYVVERIEAAQNSRPAEPMFPPK